MISITVDLGNEEHSQLLKRAKEMHFDSVDLYVKDLLRQVLEQLTSENPSSTEKSAGSSEDEARVKDRLEQLGYLD